MISRRIKFIASLINSKDKVLDVGTDHALLPIYLIKNSITSIADGSDISNDVLLNAKNNISKYKLDSKINLYLSDGLESVDAQYYNTLVITGMGFYTIKHILDNKAIKSINKLIIQSNNNHEELRLYLNSIGFKIISDNYIKDKGKPYLIIVANRGEQKLSKAEYICGLYNPQNIWYYEYILNKYNEILKKLPSNTENDLELKIRYFEEYLSKEKTED